MRCPLCKSLRGALVDMELSGAPGLWFCPTEDCPAIVTMRDLGYQPFIVARAEPSLFRIPEPGGCAPIIRLCQYAPCGLPLSSENPRAEYHTECGKRLNTELSNAAKRQSGERRSHHRVTPDVQQRSERTARILAKVSTALAGVGAGGGQ